MEVHLKRHFLNVAGVFSLEALPISHHGFSDSPHKSGLEDGVAANQNFFTRLHADVCDHRHKGGASPDFEMLAELMFEVLGEWNVAHAWRVEHHINRMDAICGAGELWYFLDLVDAVGCDRKRLFDPLERRAQDNVETPQGSSV